MQGSILSLLSWCNTNNILIDSRLRIICRTLSGIAVFNLGDSYIPQGATLVKIPKDAVLSVKSCRLDTLITTVPYGVGAQLALSLTLYVEMLQGRSSRWYGYLQSLPDGMVDLPIFWDYHGSVENNDRIKDGREALTWVRGTELEKLLQYDVDTDLISLDQLDRYFYNVVQPFICQNISAVSSMSTLEGFYRAYSLVSSRAFLVDAYHGLSMVPIADAFNHVVENHVHLETDYHVCPECGSLNECPHDYDENDSGSPSPHRKAGPRGSDHDSLYEMVSNGVIPPQMEVFNAYGEKLTNAQLLVQYGFILDLNENDCLMWTAEEVLHSLEPHSSDHASIFIAGHFRETLDHPSLDGLLELISESDLIYSNMEQGLCLNADGKLSHQLWIFLLLLCCHRNVGRTDFFDTLETLFALQLQLEHQDGLMEDDEDRSELEDDVRDPQAAGILLQLSRLVIELCRSRKNRTGKIGSCDQDPGETLDNLPDSMTRTRMAVSIVVGEKSILDSCEATWMEVMTAVDFS